MYYVDIFAGFLFKVQRRSKPSHLTYRSDIGIGIVAIQIRVMIVPLTSAAALACVTFLCVVQCKTGKSFSNETSVTAATADMPANMMIVMITNSCIVYFSKL